MTSSNMSEVSRMKLAARCTHEDEIRYTTCSSSKATMRPTESNRSNSASLSLT